VTGSYNVTRPNGLLPAGIYIFAADGKMIDPPIKDGPQADKTFWVDDIQQLAGTLVAYKDAYYYIGEDHTYVVSCTVELTADAVKGSPFIPGEYDFDSAGKLIVYDGPQENGFFYVEGNKQYGPKLICLRGCLLLRG